MQDLINKNLLLVPIQNNGVQEIKLGIIQNKSPVSIDAIVLWDLEKVTDGNGNEVSLVEDSFICYPFVPRVPFYTQSSTRIDGIAHPYHLVNKEVLATPSMFSIYPKGSPIWKFLFFEDPYRVD